MRIRHISTQGRTGIHLQLPFPLSFHVCFVHYEPRKQDILYRYNHDAESGDDESTPMFGSFSTASPRHSVVGLEPSTSPANLLAAAAATTSAVLVSFKLLYVCELLLYTFEL